MKKWVSFFSGFFCFYIPFTGKILFLSIFLNYITISAATVKSEEFIAQGIETFNQAYNAWEPKLFLQADSQFKKALSDISPEPFAHYWIGVVQFHIMNYFLFGTEDAKNKIKGNEALELGIKAIVKMIDMHSDHAESLALLGTMYGIKIYQKPYLAPILGPKVFKLLNKGLDIQPENPRIHYLIGVSYIFTPEILGGGVDKGLHHLMNAEQLFVKEHDNQFDILQPRWGYSTCLGFIGKGFLKKRNNAKAQEYFNKALRINPNDLLAQSGLNEILKKKK